MTKLLEGQAREGGDGEASALRVKDRHSKVKQCKKRSTNKDERLFRGSHGAWECVRGFVLLGFVYRKFF